MILKDSKRWNEILKYGPSYISDTHPYLSKFQDNIIMKNYTINTFKVYQFIFL